MLRSNNRRRDGLELKKKSSPTLPIALMSQGCLDSWHGAGAFPLLSQLT